MTGDAGVGFLAVGVVLLLAAVWMDIRVVQAASVAAVVHSAPHLLFHLRHQNDALDWVDTALSNGGLAMGSLLALAVLVVVIRAGPAEPCKKTEDRREPIPSVGSTATDNGERKDVLQMRLRRTFGWLAGASIATTLVAGVPAAHAAPSVVSSAGPLSDLLPAASATDGAFGRLYAVARGDGTTYFIFVVTGLDPAYTGKTYGAHVHVGPCVAGNGPAALGHYNTGTGGPPSPDNEVWLDFTVLPGGVAVSRAIVPFEIAPGTARSVVVHEAATQPGTGLAGGRVACLPVQF